MITNIGISLVSLPVIIRLDYNSKNKQVERILNKPRKIDNKSKTRLRIFKKFRQRTMCRDIFCVNECPVSSI